MDAPMMVVIHRGTSTIELTSCDAETQYYTGLKDQAVECDIKNGLRSCGTSTSPKAAMSSAPQRNVGVQCKMKDSSAKNATVLQKQNDELQARLAQKSMAAEENAKQIIQLQKLSDSLRQSSARSRESTQLADLQEQLKLKTETVQKLNLELKRLETLSKKQEASEGVRKELEARIREQKGQIVALEEKHAKEMKATEELKQELISDLLKERQKSQQFEEDKQEAEKLNARQTQELINNTLKAKQQSQILEKKQHQLLVSNIKARKELKLMVEIKVQQKLINQSLSKQKLAHNENVPLQTILEEEIQSQLNGSASFEDQIMREDFDKVIANLKEQHEKLVERFKGEVETSSRNAQYFLEENQQQELNYNKLVADYNA